MRYVDPEAEIWSWRDWYVGWRGPGRKITIIDREGVWLSEMKHVPKHSMMMTVIMMHDYDNDDGDDTPNWCQCLICMFEFSPNAGWLSSSMWPKVLACRKMGRRPCTLFSNSSGRVLMSMTHMRTYFVFGFPPPRFDLALQVTTYSCEPCLAANTTSYLPKQMQLLKCFGYQNVAKQTV